MTSKLSIVLYSHDLPFHAHRCLNRTRRGFVYFVSQKYAAASFGCPALLATWDIGYASIPTRRYWVKHRWFSMTPYFSRTNSRLLRKTQHKYVTIFCKKNSPNERVFSILNRLIDVILSSLHNTDNMANFSLH